MKKRIFFFAPFLLTGCMTEAEKASIGIIGGADGPTAIFVSSTVAAPAMLAAAVVVVLLIVGTVIAAVMSHKRK